MSDSFEDFLKSLQNIESVICNDLAFIKKLRISKETYRYLSKAELLGDFLSLSVGSLAGGTTAVIAWFSSASIFTQIGLALGLVSIPVSWPVVGAIIGGGGFFLGRKIFRKFKNKTIEEVPKYIKAPIDLIANNLLNILFPVAFKIMLSDGELHEKELKTFRKNLVSKWGYCPDFIDFHIELAKNKLTQFQDFKYEDLKELLINISKMDEGLDYQNLAIAILEEVIEIIKADGKIDPQEEKELSNILKVLNIEYKTNEL